jgi:hypothetical protein
MMMDSWNGWMGLYGFVEQKTNVENNPHDLDFKANKVKACQVFSGVLAF